MTAHHPHAFITGSAKRVGRKLALTLAQAGYNITLHYRHSAAEVQHTYADIVAFGVKCHIVQGDLQELAEMESLMTEATAALGAVTLLVNNASLFEKDDLTSLTPDMLQRHMDINSFAPMLLSRGFVAQLPPKTQGHIVCLLDGMHGWSVSPAFLSYSLSKLALQQFITLTAASLAPQVRLNGIALGATLEGHMDKPDTFTKTAAISPLKRNSTPQEVCDTLLYLERTPTITGQVISLSSGLHL
jgi:NAD(P)-dependent dehydrogenase (short-subunit alcohol dehydrogenase family)